MSYSLSLAALAAFKGKAEHCLLRCRALRQHEQYLCCIVLSGSDDQAPEPQANPVTVARTCRAVGFRMDDWNPMSQVTKEKEQLITDVLLSMRLAGVFRTLRHLAILL